MGNLGCVDSCCHSHVGSIALDLKDVVLIQAEKHDVNHSSNGTREL